MNSIELNKFLDTVNENQIKTDFIDLSADEFRNKYNLSFGNFSVVKKHFNLYLSKDEINAKRKLTWQNKETSLTSRHSNLLSEVSSYDIENYYIIDNNSFEDTFKYFNITSSDLLFLLNTYNLKKSKKLSNKLCKSKKQQLYGDSNYNNRDKSKQTCLDRYGVDNPFKSHVLMQNSYLTKEENNGIGNCNNWIKNHKTRIENSGSLEESYQKQHKVFVSTCKEKYGVDNVSKLDAVKDKIRDNCESTFLEKYGSTCYWTTPNAILSNGNNSSYNRNFEKLLENYGIAFEREFCLRNRRYDFKVGNNLIEINPSATHNSTWGIINGTGLDKNYHYNKSKLAEENKYRCIHVWDWDNIDSIVKLLLPRERIYARKCVVKEVNRKDAVLFINEFHLQGYAKDNIRLGLYYNDNLVSIMTFDKPRYNKNYQYELVRYCSSCDIIGGASKLFKHFINTYNPESIISYCDKSKFNGETYSKLGFVYKSCSVGKHWFNIKTGKHITDNLLRQRGFDQLLGNEYGNFGKGMSNKELMLKFGFVELYDSGQATYIYKTS